MGKSAKRGGATYISEQESESESDSQPLATRRLGGKLQLASLPEIQAGPTKESTNGTDSRGEARNGASERMMIENPEGEQNEGASTSATGRASKKSETEKRNNNEGDITEEAPKAMAAAGGKKKRTAKQRLDSYSSQDSESDTAS